MTRLTKSALLAVVPVMAITIGLSGCKTAKSPGEVCSAQDTFNGLLGIMVPAKAGNPSVADLSKFVTFTLPTVANIDQATKKVDCHAMMTVTGSKGVVSAARGGDLDLQALALHTLSLAVPVNDQAADHISFQIAYSVQPTADGNDTVFDLAQADTLSKIVGSAISTMKQEAADQAAAAAPPAQPTDIGNAAGGDQAGSNDSQTVEPPTPPDTYVAASNGTPAAPTDVSGAEPGMTYDKVRGLVTAAGFSPVPRMKDNDCGSADQCSFPEAESCTSTVYLFCKFVFLRGSTRLTVVGSGETEEGKPGTQKVDSISVTQVGAP